MVPEKPETLRYIDRKWYKVNEYVTYQGSWYVNGTYAYSASSENNSDASDYKVKGKYLSSIFGAENGLFMSKQNMYDASGLYHGYYSKDPLISYLPVSTTYADPSGVSRVALGEYIQVCLPEPIPLIGFRIEHDLHVREQEEASFINGSGMCVLVSMDGQYWTRPELGPTTDDPIEQDLPMQWMQGQSMRTREFRFLKTSYVMAQFVRWVFTNTSVFSSSPMSVESLESPINPDPCPDCIKVNKVVMYIPNPARTTVERVPVHTVRHPFHQLLPSQVTRINYDADENPINFESGMLNPVSNEIIRLISETETNGTLDHVVSPDERCWVSRKAYRNARYHLYDDAEKKINPVPASYGLGDFLQFTFKDEEEYISKVRNVPKGDPTNVITSCQIYLPSYLLSCNTDVIMTSLSYQLYASSGDLDPVIEPVESATADLCTLKTTSKLSLPSMLVSQTGMLYSISGIVSRAIHYVLPDQSIVRITDDDQCILAFDSSAIAFPYSDKNPLANNFDARKVKIKVDSSGGVYYNSVDDINIGTYTESWFQLGNLNFHDGALYLLAIGGERIQIVYEPPAYVSGTLVASSGIITVQFPTRRPLKQSTYKIVFTGACFARLETTAASGVRLVDEPLNNYYPVAVRQVRFCVAHPAYEQQVPLPLHAFEYESYTVSCSSYLNEQFREWNAFMNGPSAWACRKLYNPNTGTYIGNTTTHAIGVHSFMPCTNDSLQIEGEWIQLDLPRNIDLKSVTLVPAKDKIERMPCSWVLLGLISQHDVIEAGAFKYREVFDVLGEFTYDDPWPVNGVEFSNLAHAADVNRKTYKTFRLVFKSVRAKYTYPKSSIGPRSTLIAVYLSNLYLNAWKDNSLVSFAFHKSDGRLIWSNSMSTSRFDDVVTVASDKPSQTSETDVTERKLGVPFVGLCFTASANTQALCRLMPNAHTYTSSLDPDPEEIVYALDLLRQENTLPVQVFLNVVASQKQGFIAGINRYGQIMWSMRSKTFGYAGLLACVSNSSYDHTKPDVMHAAMTVTGTPNVAIPSPFPYSSFSILSLLSAIKQNVDEVQYPVYTNLNPNRYACIITKNQITVDYTYSYSYLEKVFKAEPFYNYYVQSDSAISMILLPPLAENLIKHVFVYGLQTSADFVVACTLIAASGVLVGNSPNVFPASGLLDVSPNLSWSLSGTYKSSANAPKWTPFLDTRDIGLSPDAIVKDIPNMNTILLLGFNGDSGNTQFIRYAAYTQVQFQRDPSSNAVITVGVERDHDLLYIVASNPTRSNTKISHSVIQPRLSPTNTTFPLPLMHDFFAPIDYSSGTTDVVRTLYAYNTLHSPVTLVPVIDPVTKKLSGGFATQSSVRVFDYTLKVPLNNLATEYKAILYNKTTGQLPPPNALSIVALTGYDQIVISKRPKIQLFDASAMLLSKDWDRVVIHAKLSIPELIAQSSWRLGMTRTSLRNNTTGGYDRKLFSLRIASVFKNALATQNLRSCMSSISSAAMLQFMYYRVHDMNDDPYALNMPPDFRFFVRNKKIVPPIDHDNKLVYWYDNQGTLIQPHIGSNQTLELQKGVLRIHESLTGLASYKPMPADFCFTVSGSVTKRIFDAKKGVQTPWFQMTLLDGVNLSVVKEAIQETVPGIRLYTISDTHGILVPVPALKIGTLSSVYPLCDKYVNTYEYANNGIYGPICLAIGSYLAAPNGVPDLQETIMTDLLETLEKAIMASDLFTNDSTWSTFIERAITSPGKSVDAYNLLCRLSSQGFGKEVTELEWEVIKPVEVLVQFPQINIRFSENKHVCIPFDMLLTLI